nr:15831_t:CDS:2 [Entrophospora candida]CAG8630006.1 11929_t:CDS:2 [Entrophospora candida]
MPFDNKKPSQNLVEIAKQANNVIGFLGSPTLIYNNEHINVIIEHYNISNLPMDLQKWTFELNAFILSKIKASYENSNFGWNSREKLQEMHETGANYLIARNTQKRINNDSSVFGKDSNNIDNNDTPIGFLLFQFTWEETMADDKQIEIDEISPSKCLEPEEAEKYDYDILSKTL